VWGGMNNLIDGILKPQDQAMTSTVAGQARVPRPGPGSERTANMERGNVARV
jgi:hypothetical protein